MLIRDILVSLHVHSWLVGEIFFRSEIFLVSCVSILLFVLFIKIESSLIVLEPSRPLWIIIFLLNRFLVLVIILHLNSFSLACDIDCVLIHSPDSRLLQVLIRSCLVALPVLSLGTRGHVWLDWARDIGWVDSLLSLFLCLGCDVLLGA